jgi:hypothetical protein
LFLRLEQLKTYGENEWKKRVKSPNDANEFTVEGKLRQAGMFFFYYFNTRKIFF